MGRLLIAVAGLLLVLPRAAMAVSLASTLDLFLACNGTPGRWRSSIRRGLLSSSASDALAPNMDASSFHRLVQAGPVPEPSRDFLINGWRWHTQAVLRDLHRFIALAQSLGLEESRNTATSQSILLQRCHAFVCGFSWRALMTIEGEIFFPWLADLLPSDVAKPLIGKLFQQHSEIRAMSSRLETLCKSCGSREGLGEVISCLEDMLIIGRSMQRVQEEVFVPFIAAYVSKREQERFNNLVLSKLGIIEANVHLVSMFDAVRTSPAEMTKFNKQIPRVVQALIPLWRRRLYVPKAKWLDPQG